MAYVHRRTFYARVGQADHLVKVFQEGIALMDRFNPPTRTRILTDYLTGRSDRVVVEWEMDKMSDLEGFFERIMSDAGFRQDFAAWEGRMNDLINYSEAETWAIR